MVSWLLPWPLVGGGASPRDRRWSQGWHGERWGVCAEFEAKEVLWAIV